MDDKTNAKGNEAYRHAVALHFISVGMNQIMIGTQGFCVVLLAVARGDGVDLGTESLVGKSYHNSEFNANKISKTFQSSIISHLGKLQSKMAQTADADNTDFTPGSDIVVHKWAICRHACKR